MAFPTTGVLDSFTGADENPIATNWSGKIFTWEDGQLRRSSNALRASSFGANGCGSYYDIGTFGADCEAYCTITTLPNVNDELTLMLRVTQPNVLNATDGYGISLFPRAGTDEIQFLRFDNSGGALMLSDTQEFSAGDKLGVEMIGNVLSAYIYTAGAWALINSHTDTNYTAAGYIGVRIFQAASETCVVDDFGGGTVVTGDTTVKLRSQHLDYDYSR